MLNEIERRCLAHLAQVEQQGESRAVAPGIAWEKIGEAMGLSEDQARHVRAALEREGFIEGGRFVGSARITRAGREYLEEDPVEAR